MATLLEVANSVLLSANERPLPNLNGIQGAQLKTNIQYALTRISQLNDWDFLYGIRPAASWAGQTATLDSDVQRIKDVYWKEDVGTSGEFRYVPILFCDGNEFYRTQVGVGFDSALSNRRPERYTSNGWQRFDFDPFPTDTAGQQRVLFRVLRTLLIPALDNDPIELPNFFVPCLVKGALAEYYRTHLEDVSLANTNQAMFEAEIQTLRDRHYRQGNQAPMNLYRRRR